MTNGIDSELPWGCWLRVQADPRSSEAFVDDRTGRTWPDIRHAFWEGRLGMPLRHGNVPQESLELLHAVLASCARGTVTRRERQDDLFGGNQTFEEWYTDWLVRERLLPTAATSIHGGGGLEAEGWAVLHMLMATRPVLVGRNRPSAATVRMLTELGLGPEEREERLQRLESAAADWDAAFLRRDVGHRPGVVLSRRGDGPVPVMQTVWTLGFDTVGQRDDFYDWLGGRLDRWPAWAQMAGNFSAGELTHKLLVVLAASLSDEGTGSVQ